MERIRIAFFDVDGTLSDMEIKRISAENLQTLHRLREKGVLVCIATGRCPAFLPRLDGFEPDVWMTCSGSLCYNAQQTIFSRPVPAEAVQRIIRNAAALGRPVTISTRDRLIANGINGELEYYYAVADWKLTVAEDFEAASRTDVYQLSTSCRKPEYPLILQGVQGAEITGWWDRAVDIIPAGGGKGLGVEKILAHYGLDRTQAIAFGDGENDIAMLQAVGCGVAMGNAREQLKAVADEVCGSVGENGVYHYCLEHGLI